MGNQSEIVARLKQFFGENNVISEWDVAKGSEDAYTRNLYCPRVDIAIGPFNIDGNIDWNNRRISEAYNGHLWLIERIKSRSDITNEALELNENPRCFLAMEIEHRSSRKHRLGSMINASAMGKIGIIVASNTRVLESLVKIRRYLEFVESVGKARYNPKNVMIILMRDFLETLRSVNT